MAPVIRANLKLTVKLDFRCEFENLLDINNVSKIEWPLRSLVVNSVTLRTEDCGFISTIQLKFKIKLLWLDCRLL